MPCTPRTLPQIDEESFINIQSTLARLPSYKSDSYSIEVSNYTNNSKESQRTCKNASRKQNANALALRAAVELARLWQAQGIGGNAKSLLVECASSFTEGFETADLIEAKKLIAELS